MAAVACACALFVSAAASSVAVLVSVTNRTPTNGTTCLSCTPPEGSYAGAVACYPGLLSVYIIDTPPVMPGPSQYDMIVFNFSRPTAQPGADPYSVALFTPPISPSTYSAAWTQNGQVLELTMLDVSAETASLQTGLLYDANTLRVEVLGYNITDVTGQSGSMPDMNFTVGGSWGNYSKPSVLSATAVNSGLAAGLNVNDSLIIQFDQNVQIYYGGAAFPNPNSSILNQLISFSSVAWTDISGRCVSVLMRSCLRAGTAVQCT